VQEVIGVVRIEEPIGRVDEDVGEAEDRKQSVGDPDDEVHLLGSVVLAGTHQEQRTYSEVRDVVEHVHLEDAEDLVGIVGDDESEDPDQ
jgi:hypothetical protein